MPILLGFGGFLVFAALLTIPGAAGPIAAFVFVAVALAGWLFRLFTLPPGARALLRKHGLDVLGMSFRPIGSPPRIIPRVVDDNWWERFG